MGIKGSLREASLPDVLQLLSMGKKTGCLSVTHRNNFGSIYFERGRICHAGIVNRRDRLGDILVKSGIITQEQLDSAIDLQSRDRDKRLGQLMIEQGMISAEDLERHILMQVEEAVYFLFTWSEGSFSFEADVMPEEQDLQISINPESLLLEGARRVDEWGLIAKKIPSFDLVFDADHKRIAASEGALTDEQRRLIELVDGRRDVAALIDASGMVEFEAGKALFGLITAGFLHRVGKSKQAIAVATDARIDEHRNLGVAFFRTGMLEEAVREFRRVLELRDSDASAKFHLGLVLMRQGKWPDAANTFHQAAALPDATAPVFHNLSYALERLGQYEEARSALDEAMKRGAADDPRVHTSLGALTLRLGTAVEADRVLSGARALWGTRIPSAPWFHYSALAAALVGDTERAAALLEEGLQHNPGAAAMLNNLAVVEERRGRYAEAEQAAERAAHDDGGLPQPHKNLGDHKYRASSYDEALEAYQRAVQLNASLGDDVYLRMGNIRARRGEQDEAVRSWERALELDSENSVARGNIDALRQRG
jgi:tetratricopeptide (TPR) repeat protein